MDDCPWEDPKCQPGPAAEEEEQAASAGAALAPVASQGLCDCPDVDLLSLQ